MPGSSRGELLPGAARVRRYVEGGSAPELSAGADVVDLRASVTADVRRACDVDAYAVLAEPSVPQGLPIAGSDGGAGGVARVAKPAGRAMPADWGWRGRVRRGTGGLVQPAAGEQERAHRCAVDTIRQATWTRAVNVVVTNPKGGVGKTPAAVVLAGVLADVRGGYVVAWEACESPGSLADRAEGRPQRGIAELLDQLSTAPGSIRSAGQVGGYTLPQSSHADVVGSLGPRRALTATDVLRAREVFDAHYRISVTDTGNNPGHETYRAALRTADAAVIPCLISDDALAGAEDALAGMADSPGLVGRTVVVLGHDGGPEDSAVDARVRSRLAQLGLPVIEVPFDVALRRGGPITLNHLAIRSRRAWTLAAAGVVDALRGAPTATDLVQDYTADR